MLALFSNLFCSQVHGDSYLEITDNPATYEQIPILLIVVGIFVLLLGTVGVVGGLFANTIAGRIMLGLVRMIETDIVDW